MTSSTLILGINPSSGRPNKISPTIQRLNRWMDHFGLVYYSFSNVVHSYGQYKPEDVDIELVKTYADGYSKIIALGPFVSKTLNRAHIEHFTLPHPSPLNRQLNDREYELMRLEECKKYLEE